MVNRTRRVLIVTLFMIGTAGLALAAHPDNGPGCGLGKLAWNDYPHQQSIGTQLFQATTNLTFFAQTFGISSGTSGCTHDGTILASEKVNVFTFLNFDDISQDMAQGQGEHLTSLATLMDIPSEQHDIFFTMTQEQYATLIQEGETSPKAVIKAIYRAMANRPIFAHSSISE